MNNFLAQLSPDLINVTGVIATILALIFALGAFYNSRSRKKHLRDLEKAQNEEKVMNFRPSASRVPGSSSHPERSSASGKSPTPPQTKTPPVAKTSNSKESPEPEKDMPSSDPSSAGTGSLFRKVRPDGIQADLHGESTETERYVWE